jgi:hypothetical protein
MKLFDRLRGHFQQHVAKYAVLVIAVLTPLAGLLGTVGADVGGASTPVGKALLGGAAALGTAITGVQYVRNLGIWQMLDTFGAAPGVTQPAAPPLPASQSAPASNSLPSELGDDDSAVDPDLESQPPTNPADVPPDEVDDPAQTQLTERGGDPA